MSGDVAPTVTVVESDPKWAGMFAKEAASIRGALAPITVLVDHVGSTSVRGLAAKPVIDILVTTRDVADVERVAAALRRQGYVDGEQVPGAEPAQYLRRFGDGGGHEVNVHVAPPASALGNRMMAFRDLLESDARLAARYASLKRDLAARYRRDLDAYTAGKSDFVIRAIADAAGALGLDRLLAHQRAELDRSQGLQLLVVTTQLALALLAAASVFSADNGTLLGYALAGFALAALWLWLGKLQRRHRAAGDLARRVVLLASGLGHALSAEQRLRVFEAFSVPVGHVGPGGEEAHFASRAAPGPTRLAEMIQESAFWTADLQRTSAATLRWMMTAYGALGVAYLWRVVPTLADDTRVSLARVLVALLVFLVSSDVVGAALAHEEAGRAIGDILQRVETAALRDFPERDVVMLMADYNSAVETAPVALPFVYRLRRKRLSRRWHEYLQAKIGS